MTDPRRRRTILLACGHTATFDPAPANGEQVYCQRCGLWNLVTDGGIGSNALVDYRADCRDCRYARSYGASRIETEVRAAAHRRRYPGHTVDLSDQSGEVYATWHPPELPALDTCTCDHTDSTDMAHDCPRHMPQPDDDCVGCLNGVPKPHDGPEGCDRPPF